VAHILLAIEFIAACHKAALHKGVKKTYTLVSERYYGISRDDVAALLKHCEICALNRPSRTRAPLTPIVVEEWLERIQIDLIDLRAEADGHMKWICHIKDHFTKYSILFATPTKASDEIAKCVSIFMMFFGIPDVFQADNGAEFKRWVLRLVHNHGVKVRNGRSRTPHIQGLVEQGNNSVKDSLRAWKAEAGRKDWSAALPEICWSMNATYHRSIKTTPYELVFGRDSTGGITFPITAGSHIYHPTRRYHLKSRMHNVSLILTFYVHHLVTLRSKAIDHFLRPLLLQDPPEPEVLVLDR